MFAWLIMVILFQGNDLLHSSSHFHSSSTCHSPLQKNFIFSTAEFQKNSRNPEQLSDDFGVSMGFPGSSRYGPLTFSGDNHKYLFVNLWIDNQISK